MFYKKKSLALVLGAVLLLSACAGTGGVEENTEEVPVLTWIVPGSPQKDAELVMKAINEITVDKIGAKVDIQFVDDSLFSDRMTMNFATGNDFDLCFTGYLNPCMDAVQNNGYYDITDYFEKSDKLKSVIPDYILTKLKIDGRLYGIPNMQIVTSSTGLFVQKDLAEEYGLDPDEIHFIEDIEPMLEWVKNNKPDIYPFKTGRYGGGHAGVSQKMSELAGMVSSTWDENGNVAFVPGYETENWQKDVRLMRDWFEKGYIRSDIASINDDENELYEKKYAVWRGAYKPGGEEEFNANYDFECIAIQLTKEYITGGTTIAAGTAIGKNSKNPELAFKLMEEVNTNVELFNLIAFGVEGENYKRNAEGKIELKKNGGWLTRGAWKFGNVFNSYILEGQNENVWEETKKFNDNAERTPITGWVFNTKPVRDEIAKMMLVKEKYSMSGNGSEPPESYLDSYIAELKAAGVYKVAAEAQKQFDEWRGKNNSK